MSDLINRQAFIENERKLYCEDCDRRKGTKNGKPNVICYEIGEAPCRACWLDDALTDLEDFPAASPWHRVEEPPKEAGEYIVAYHPCHWDNVVTKVTKVGIDNFRGKSAWAKKKFQRVTHWMEKPKPPQEDS